MSYEKERLFLRRAHIDTLGQRDGYHSVREADQAGELRRVMSSDRVELHHLASGAPEVLQVHDD